MPNHQARARANYCPHPLPSFPSLVLAGSSDRVAHAQPASPQIRNPQLPFPFPSRARPPDRYIFHLQLAWRGAGLLLFSPGLGLRDTVKPFGRTLQEAKELRAESSPSHLPIRTHFTPTCVRMSHKTHATISAGAAAGGLVRMTTRPLESPDIISGGGRLLPQRRFHGTFDAGRRRR